MLFGNLFYKKINGLANWQQTLFALVLTTRMYPNLKLYSETNSLDIHKTFKKNLDLLWDYLEFHEQQIDFNELQAEFLELTPEYNDEDNLGKITASLACQALLITFDSSLNHTKKEALLASEKSVVTVIKYLEVRDNTIYTDDQIVEQDAIQAELDFQMKLVDLLNHKRNEHTFENLKEMAENSGFSNIGIPVSD